MSRRRKPRTPATSTTPPNDGTPLGGLSDADLLREVARRRLTKGSFDIDAIEELAGAAQRDMGEETLAAALAALSPEDDKPKACPKCKQLVPVKAKNRLRHILTTAGELRLARNYHYCTQCGRGFAPRDAELNLPEEGEVSSAMERRILDFGINDTFESVAERWSIHFPTSISSNLVRRVMDRVGLRCEAAYSEEALQVASSMLLTREESWKEVKVGVVARGGFNPPGAERPRRRVEDARYDEIEWRDTRGRHGLPPEKTRRPRASARGGLRQGAARRGEPLASPLAGALEATPRRRRTERRHSTNSWRAFRCCRGDEPTATR